MHGFEFYAMTDAAPQQHRKIMPPAVDGGDQPAKAWLCAPKNV
jgi:hypothetical protein